MLRSLLTNAGTTISNAYRRWNQYLFAALKPLILLWFVYVTNFGFLDRVWLLFDNGRWGTLIPYLVIWLVAIIALIVIAYHPKRWVRLAWGTVMSLSGSVHLGYFLASGSDLNVFDILLLMNASHETSRGLAFYMSAIVKSFIVFAISVFGFWLKPVQSGKRLNIWTKRLALLPLLPTLAVAAIVWFKGGTGSQALPSNVTPLALSGVTGFKILFRPPPDRKSVAWTPAKPLHEKIVFIMDESVRADYLNLEPGNAITPNIAATVGKLVNYGVAMSGGNCSHYSNALMRFGVSLKKFDKSVNQSPSIWEYAKRAGYHTIYIDAQTGAIKNPGVLHNFMTVREKSFIDEYIAIGNVTDYSYDDKLFSIADRVMSMPGPVFIYANKNGAHFPYDHAYPADQAKFHPTETENGKSLVTQINSYINVLEWSVDRLFPRMVEIMERNKAFMVYTSDHGQAFGQGLTHCQTDHVDQRTAQVPLMLHVPEGPDRALYTQAAKTLHNKSSHFMITPTLLRSMGYAEHDVSSEFSNTLLKSDSSQLRFTTGDIFGLFSDERQWNDFDPNKDMLEPEAKKLFLQKSAATAE